MDYIASKEKSHGKVFKGLGVLMLLIAFFILWFVIFEKSGQAWVASFMFLAMSAVFWGIGDYQQKKFDVLGETPLVITSKESKIGELLTGKIIINKIDFSKISQVSLTNFYYDGRQYDNGKIKKLRSVSGACEALQSNESTWLLFSIEVPISGKPTEDLRNRRYYWELSVEYTDKLTLYKRTWPVEILPAEDTVMMA